ncbi:MAG: cytochrome c3 family protein, partial [Planctomycetota bacterium]
MQHDHRPRPQPRRWWQRSSVWVGVFALAVACATFVPQQGWNPAAGPVVPHDTFPADCSLCHKGGDWHSLREDFTFDHGARTGTTLGGAHKNAGCLLCHNDRGPVQQFAARGCAGCHADPHLARLGATCADCHNERTWYPREAIAMHDRTRFPLVGAHAAAACFRCHPGAQVGNFAGALSECAQCHQADFARTTNPNHVLSNFSRSCETCHTPLGWKPARFDHPGSFPLSLGHAGRACSECHTTANSFVGLSTGCASCHSDDFA